MTPKKIRQISIRLLISFCGIFTSLQVYSQCVTSIITAPVVNTVCNGQTITLTASNPGASGFTWVPAATLNTNTGASVIASPTSTTTYTVTPSGCSPATPVTVVVTVLPSPNAGFSFSPNNAPCSSTPINFSNSSTGSGLTYSWNFGNPASGSQNTSTSTNPSHLFVAYGVGNSNFNVTLTATSSNGCSDNISQTVTVQNSPNASITDPSGNDFSNCDGISSFLLSINNSSTTQSTNTNYVINWGDGTPNYSGATLPDGTTHTYNGFGFNTITLTVTGSNGCVSNSTYNFFNGSNPSVGLANPGGTVGLCAPAILSFPVTNTALNPPGTTYTVEYNDGSPNEVYTHPPPATIIHTFNNSSCGVTSLGGFQNAFHVRIVASNPCGTSAALIEPIRVGLPPTVAFNGPSVVCVNTTASYNSSSTGIVVNNAGNCVNTINHFWSVTPSTGWSIASGSFGNSTTNVSGSTSIGLNYSQPGIYTIQLIAKNQCGADTLTQNVCVTVPPTPSFTINPTSACAPALITTTNNSTATACSPLTYSWSVTPTTGWSFASGNSTSVAPSFNFTEAGSYTITLAVTNVCGTFNTSQPVIIKTIPSVTLPTYPANCGSISINPSATINDGGGTISSYSWTFSGGTPSTSSLANPPSVNFNTPGNHVITLTVTNECGSATATTSVTVNPLPNVSTISNTTICNGEVVNLVTNPTGGSSPYSFSWSPGTGLSNPFAQSPNANPSSTTTYSVTVTDLNLCTASTSAIITVNPIPIVSISGIQTICDGQQTNLSASGATSYTWSPTSSLNTSTGNSVTASPTITTTYTVIGSFSTGCSATTTYIVTVNPLPVVNAGPDISVCNQPIATVLTGFSPAGGVWSGPGVTASGVFTPSATGTFTLYYSFTNANGCSGIDSILVSVISSLLANAGNGFSICVNAPAFNLNTLNPTPVGGTWSGNGVVGGNFNPAGLSGQQILTYSLGAGTCLTTDTIHIFVNPLPVMNVNSPVFCIEDDATLIVNGANTYSWSPSTGLSATTGSSVIANPTVTTTYTITGTNSLTGCSNSINSVVTVNPLPVVNAGPDISVCNQPIATQLSGFSPAGGVWSGPGVTGAGVFIPSAVGTFTLIYTFTNSNSCVNKDSIIVSVIDPTLANAGTGFGICVTAPPVNLSSLNPTPVGGTWSGNGVVGSSFNPAGLNGQQILTYTVGTGTCLTTDTIRVNVHPLPVLNVNSGTICVEDDITLTAGGANTYVWSPSAGLSATTGGSVTANPTITTTYTITGTNTATGCTNTINSVVTVNPLPVVNAGSDISVCNQPIIEILTGYSPAGGTWSGNGVSSGGNFTPNGTGNYTLTYTFVNANLCVNQDSIVVSVINPSVTNAGTGFSICNQAATVTLNTLNPTPAGGSWTGSGVNANIFDPTTIAPGQYILTYTVGAGTCQTSDTIRVTVNPNPNPVVPNTAYCFGETGTITINGTDNYVWSPATDLNTTSGNSVITSTQSNTTYTVTATNSFNCSTNVSANVVVHPLPIITFDQNPVSLCYNSSTIITASGASQYQWIPDIGLNQSTGASVTISTTVTTTYTVTGTTGFGCIDSVFLPVSVNDPTDANPTNDAICFGGNTTLTVTNASTYFWSPAAGLSSQTADVVTANPQVSTTYTVVGTTSSGCTSSDIVPITVNPLPVVSIAPSSITQCAESPATLNADGALNYLWSPNISLSASTGNSVIVNPNTNTTYSVLGTDNNGCTGSATTTITVYPLPAIDAGSNITVCHTGITVTLGGFTPQGGTWNGPGIINGTGALFDPLNAGLGVHTVYYNIINANGCTNIDSITITVTPVTYPVAGPGDTLCFLDPVINLTGNAPAGGTWLGFGITNAVTGQFNPTLTGPGLHPVIYTIGQGQCTTGDTTIVLVRPLPLLSFSPNPADICVGDDIVLTISGANDYVWTPSATLNTSTGASVIANPTVNTTYTVIGIDVEGCSSTTQVPLIVHPLPLVDAGANQTVCSFDPPTYIFNFSPFGGLWTGTGITDGFTGEFSPQVSGPGTFTITYTATDIYNCTNQDDMVITVLNPVAANAGTDQSVCVNEPAFNLTGFSPAGGSWQGIGITNPTLGTFNPALAGVGVHKLIYSPPSSQCIYKDSILITVLPEPTITIIASDLTLCSGQSSNITASGGNTYTWSPSASLNTSTGSTVQASPTLTTTYTVTTVDANTCTSSNTIIITMNPVPNVTITPAALAICTGQSMNLTAGGANTYTWSPSNGLNQTTGTTVTTSATINTTYTVTGTDINGCVSTQDISVVVLQLPNLTLTEQDQWICNGSSTQLFASGAQSYTWSPFSSLNASQGSAVIASPNVTTTYTVTGTDANGCQDSDTISVTVHPPPITFNVQPQICQWETVNLIANGANEYTWTPSFGLNTSTGASVLATPTLTTTYTVVGTDIYGCTGSNAVIVTVHFPTITINPDSAEICNGQSQVFSASGAVQYAWYPSNGLNVTTSANVTASPSLSTTYTLIGTDVYGCPDTVLVPLIVHPQPEALFTYTPPEGCDSLLVTFTNLSTDADIFLWTFSDGTNSTELNPAHWFSGPGNYDVTLYVEGTGGCNDSETITDAITVWPMPVAEFAWRQSNYPVINGEVFFDNNSLNADTYNWNFGDSTYSTAVNPSHQYQQYGTYFVTLIATNDFDCKDTIVKPISVKFYKGLYLPNAMTPEYGDPATRVFTPKGFNLKSYRIQIYDTWGNMLWESTKLTERGEPAESWDGYYNGQLLQQDVYVWKVEATFLDDTVWEGMQYPSGEIKPTGTVTILR